MFRSVALLFFVLIAPSVSFAATFRDGDAVNQEAISGDGFITGTTITVPGKVEGELFAAGTSVSVAAQPGRSAFLAGQNVTDGAGSGYDLFAIGQTVTLHGTYAHDVYVAGTRVRIERDTVIKGDLYAVTNNLSLGGIVNGSAQIQASKLILDGPQIDGTLSYSATQMAEGLSGSKIGSVHYQEPVRQASENPLGWLIPLFATVLGAGLLQVLAPSTGRLILDRLRRSFWRCLGVGWAILLLTPLLILLLIATLIGYKLAILLLCLYVSLLTVASLLGAVVAGRLVLERVRPVLVEHPWLVSLLGSCIVFGLGSITGIGILLGLLLFPALVGAGAGALRRRRG